MARRSGGYTVLEVMLFLAISAFIFISAAVAVGGRQRRVQYTQAVREFEGQMQDVLNDVAAGYYPPPDNLECSVTGSGAVARPQLSPAGGSPTEQGSSDYCMSIGKVVYFDFTEQSDPSEYATSTLVGIKPSIDASSQISAEDANPIMAPELTDYRNLRFGIEVTGIYDASSGQSYNAFAIASGFTGASAVKNGLVQTNLYASRLPLVPKAAAAYAADFEGLDGPNITKPSNGIVVCLYYPADDKRARVYIGEGGSINNIRSDLDVTTGVCST